MHKGWLNFRFKFYSKVAHFSFQIDIHLHEILDSPLHFAVDDLLFFLILIPRRYILAIIISYLLSMRKF